MLHDLVQSDLTEEYYLDLIIEPPAQIATTTAVVCFGGFSGHYPQYPLIVREILSDDKKLRVHLLNTAGSTALRINYIYICR